MEIDYNMQIGHKADNITEKNVVFVVVVVDTSDNFKGVLEHPNSPLHGYLLFSYSFLLQWRQLSVSFTSISYNFYTHVYNVLYYILHTCKNLGFPWIIQGFGHYPGIQSICPAISTMPSKLYASQWSRKVKNNIGGGGSR